MSPIVSFAPLDVSEMTLQNQCTERYKSDSSFVFEECREIRSELTIVCQNVSIKNVSEMDLTARRLSIVNLLAR